MTRPLTALFLSFLFGVAWAQQPVRILVGFPVGGTIDTVARLLAEQMKDDLGAAVVVDSRPGAGGQIAAQAQTLGLDDSTRQRALSRETRVQLRRESAEVVDRIGTRHRIHAQAARLPVRRDDDHRRRAVERLPEIVHRAREVVLFERDRRRAVRDEQQRCACHRSSRMRGA